jgi:hypothetical protein
MLALIRIQVDPTEAARLTQEAWVPWLCGPASRRVCSYLAE